MGVTETGRWYSRHLDAFSAARRRYGPLWSGVTSSIPHGASFTIRNGGTDYGFRVAPLDPNRAERATIAATRGECLVGAAFAYPRDMPTLVFLAGDVVGVAAMHGDTLTPEVLDALPVGCVEDVLATFAAVGTDAARSVFHSALRDVVAAAEQ